MQAIAERAGVTIPAIIRYFPDKSLLQRAAVDQSEQSVARVHASKAEPEETLIGQLTEYFMTVMSGGSLDNPAESLVWS